MLAIILKLQCRVQRERSNVGFFTGMETVPQSRVDEIEEVELEPVHEEEVGPEQVEQVQVVEDDPLLHMTVAELRAAISGLSSKEREAVAANLVQALGLDQSAVILQANPLATGQQQPEASSAADRLLSGSKAATSPLDELRSMLLPPPSEAGAYSAGKQQGRASEWLMSMEPLLSLCKTPPIQVTCTGTTARSSCSACCVSCSPR